MIRDLVSYRQRVFKETSPSFLGHLMWTMVCGCGLRTRTGTWEKAMAAAPHYKHEDFHP